MSRMVTTLYTRAPQPRWVLNSAATRYICWDRACFSSLRPYRQMFDTAGDLMKPERIGTVKFALWGNSNQPLMLKNVYFAPRVGMNLIGVLKLLLVPRWWRILRSTLCNAEDGRLGLHTTRRRIC